MPPAMPPLRMQFTMSMFGRSRAAARIATDFKSLRPYVRPQNRRACRASETRLEVSAFTLFSTISVRLKREARCRSIVVPLRSAKKRKDTRPRQTENPAMSLFQDCLIRTGAENLPSGVLGGASAPLTGDGVPLFARADEASASAAAAPASQTDFQRSPIQSFRRAPARILKLRQLSNRQ